ncbi:MAG: DNA recombination protein RmuC [Oscillospiraceae bacterium]|jgi:DNA recombination protein RmuC|nr:DNA recombination protein RmuC [Oscillospiraceae bacterium]
MPDILQPIMEFIMVNWALCAGIIGALVVVLLLVRGARRREAQAREQMETMQETLNAQLEKANAQAAEQAVRDREQMQGSLLSFNDSVVRVINEMSRTQQGQLDSFGGQIRASGHNDEERMERMRTTVEQRLTSYEQRMDRITQVLESNLERMQTQNQQKLEEMRVTVDEKLHATLDRRLGESFQLVSERLEEVTKGLGEMQSLASGVGDLKKVLTNVKTRGVWGEVQLGSLLEQILTPSQYRANAQVRPHSAERVDYAIVLPGKGEDADREVLLPIDAKFPQEDYRRLVDAADQGDPAATDAATRAFENAVRLQAKRINEKYIEPPYTTDYAILFLPTEGLYAEVLRGALVEQLQEQYRVIVAGPTTLAALLNSLQMGFRTLAIERRSSEVWALLGAVKTEFGRFADLLTKTQKKLQQASDSIEDAARKTRTIQRRLRDVGELPERETVRLLDEDAGADAAPAAEDEDAAQTELPYEDEAQDDWE